MCEENSSTCYIAKLTCTLQIPDRKLIDLHAFDKILQTIAGVALTDLQPKHLLKAKQFGVTFHDGVIRSVCREPC